MVTGGLGGVTEFQAGGLNVQLRGHDEAPDILKIIKESKWQGLSDEISSSLPT
jgi:hypothetical protein